MNNNFSFIALGDSYTIGEAVPLHKNFPYQTVQMLRKRGYNFLAPEIIAKTGWTTNELQRAIDEYSFLSSYDFISLLIGVNNQYRGLSSEKYEVEFTRLLSKAIVLANQDPDHVFVFSIPDYSVTPFAQKLDHETISKDIDRFNKVNKRAAAQFGVPYLDINPSSRQFIYDHSLVAEDGLHPSEKEYAKWAVMLSDCIYDRLKAKC